MSCTWVIVAEAESDVRIATTLADRILSESAEWIRDSLEHLRAWIHETGEHGGLIWSNIPKIASKLRVKAHGHFSGTPGIADAIAARKALRVVERLFPQAKAVLLIRDVDKQPEREQGLNQARDEQKTGVKVVLGVAKPKMEAWVLAGFEPRDEAESAVFATVKKDLGFNPRTDSHELTASHDHDNRSAKRVLDQLAPDFDRREECWRNTTLATLRERGEKNGLAKYLCEIESHLKPLLTARP